MTKTKKGVMMTTTTQKTCKRYKLAKVLSFLLLIITICLAYAAIQGADIAQSKPNFTPTIISGIITILLYLYAHIDAWWNNG